MKRIRKIYILPIILLIIFLIIIGVYYFYFKNFKAAVIIESIPSAEVVINEEKQGKTPYEQEFGAEEITLKLIPESFGTPLIPYEAKVKLTSGVTTIVRREFSEEEEGDSGELISFEKIGGSENSIAVIAKPDGSKVYIDNEFIDLAPAKESDLSPGEHEVSVRADNYIERKFKVMVINGYGVTAIVELSIDKNAKVEEEESNTEEVIEEENEDQIKIKIKETTVGFLRVRSGPTTNDPEIGRVDPGAEFEVIETDSASGWYKIEYKTDSEGWISNEFAEII